MSAASKDVALNVMAALDGDHVEAVKVAYHLLHAARQQQTVRKLAGQAFENAEAAVLYGLRKLGTGPDR